MDRCGMGRVGGPRLSKHSGRRCSEKEIGREAMTEGRRHSLEEAGNTGGLVLWGLEGGRISRGEGGTASARRSA